MISFASDNNSGIDPEILSFFNEVNKGSYVGYGDDYWTEKSREVFQNMFGKDTIVYFVSTGTAANVIGLSAFLMPYESVLCSDEAHINTDETGSIHRFIGCTLHTIENHNGKITVDELKKRKNSLMEVHNAKPKVVSISQSTEYETIYSREEICEIAKWAHSENLYLHVDGARIANAAVASGCSIKELTKDCGVDLLTLGATKNGCFSAEAIVFFNTDKLPDCIKTGILNLEYSQKQGMNLISKMRFCSSQFIPYLKDGLWKTNAEKANNMALYLEDKLKMIDKVEIAVPVITNALFVKLPERIVERLREKYFFYTMSGNIHRFMCSFNTKKKDIDDFISYIKLLLNEKL